jgi:Ca2+/Na+ antiporter
MEDIDMNNDRMSNIMMLVAVLVLFSLFLDARLGIVLSVVSMVVFAVYIRRAKREQ